MHGPDPSASPVNPLPKAVILLAGLIGGIELMFSGAEAGLFGGPGAIGWRMGAIERWGLPPGLVEWMWTNGRAPWPELARFLSFPLIHYSFTHAVFALVFVLALGKMVGEVFRPWAVLAVFWGASAAAGIVFSLLPGTGLILAGGFPGAYGLIGAFTWLLWMNLGAAGARRWRAFTLIAVLMGVQLLFGALFGTSPDWPADLAGFAAGFALSFVVSPGGPRQLVARLRRR